MPDFIWSGTLTFGLVTIPVQLVPAISRKGTSLTLLHRKDRGPLERRMVCPVDGEVVEPKDRVRGFEIEKGEYVTVTDEELESLAPERSKAIEIEEFVELDRIDPLFFDRPYYLAPDKGAERPYGLLAQALREAGKAGLARFVLREREHLVALWVVEDLLCLTTLRYERQRVSSRGLVPEKARVSRESLDELLEQMEKESRSFDPSAYEDENEIRLLKLIREKGKEEGVENAPRAKGHRKPSEERLTKGLDRKIREAKGSS